MQRFNIHADEFLQPFSSVSFKRFFQSTIREYLHIAFQGSQQNHVGGTLITEFFSSALYNYLLNGVNELIPSEQRATLISFESMIYSVFMIGIFPLAGWLCDVFSMEAVFGTMGLVLFAAYILFAASAPKKEKAE